MKSKRQASLVLSVLLVLAVILSACGPATQAAPNTVPPMATEAATAEATATPPPGATQAPPTVAPSPQPSATSGVVATQSSEQGLTKMKIGLTAFQDMLSIKFGNDKGFYKQAGLDLEIVDLPYEVVTEAYASGAIDIGAICETTVVTDWDKFPQNRIVNIFYTFEGSAIMARPNSGMETYQDFYKQLGDSNKAAAATVKQLKGKTIVTTMGTDMEMGTVSALEAGGMSLSDVKIIDMNPDDGLAAFLSGTGDAYLGGLPHRTRLVKEGYLTLITAQDLGPSAVTLCGFGARDDYVKTHQDALVKFTRGTFLTLQYIDSHKDEAFGHITSDLNSLTGATMTVNDLNALWDNIEFFPSTGAEMYKLLIQPDGRRYWKTRMEFVYDYYHGKGQVTNPMDYDTIFPFKDILAQYMKTYEPAEWAKITPAP